MIKDQWLGKNLDGTAGGLIEALIIPPLVWTNWEAQKQWAPAGRDSNKARYRLQVGSVTTSANLLRPRDKRKYHNAVRAVQQMKTPARTVHIAALKRMDSSVETNFVVPRVNSEVYIPTRFAGPRCRELKLIGGYVFWWHAVRRELWLQNETKPNATYREKDNLCLWLAFALQTNISVFKWQLQWHVMQLCVPVTRQG